MMNCGRGTENDIEMIILAFSENKWQYYVPYGKQQKMSKAIKSFVRFENSAAIVLHFIADNMFYNTPPMLE